MKKLIKFATRPNLKYPLQYLLYGELRDVESILLDEYLNFSDSLLFTPLMFMGEFFGGLIVFLYQKKFVRKTLFNNEDTDKYMNLELIKTRNSLRVIDNIFKIIFIIFCCALFDFIQFIVSNNTPKFINISFSINTRLRALLIIFDALFYYFVLKLPVLRHQLLCLIIIGFCLLITIITEFVFQEINIFLSYGQFIYIIFLSFFSQFFRAMIDSGEKYLSEYDNTNLFYALSLEGLFGFILSLIHNLFYEPFKKINDFKKNKTSSEFGILIFCFIIYIILSALKNLFRVETTKIFTPMAATSIEYILNPIILIIYFSLSLDFTINQEKKYAHFFINLIIGIIISFFSLVYNELLILFFCNLDKDTYLQISDRSKLDQIYIDLEDIDNIDNIDNEYDD